MKRVFLAITIDVEPDCSSNWRYSDPLTFAGVSVGIKNILQPLFTRYETPPTYLINNVVLEDKQSVAILSSLNGRFELGTHLHPEFIEPDKKYFEYAGKKAEANCCFLRPEVERHKLESITQLFKEQFGYNPVSFRAGRFSAGVNTISSLIDLGYKVDSSVTPAVTWNDPSREGIVDYSRQSVYPYWLDKGSFPDSSDSKKLLEVPVSIIKMKRWPRRPKTCWLRPVYSTDSEMIRLSKKIIENAPPNAPVILNMMFHNVEVMPGLSPYASNQDAANRLINQIENYLKWCQKKNILGITLEDYYEKFS